MSLRRSIEQLRPARIKSTNYVSKVQYLLESRGSGGGAEGTKTTECAQCVYAAAIFNGEKLKVGDDVISGENVPLKNANSLPLKNIPAGINVHNIELSPGKGGQLARSAGSYAQVMAHDNKLCTLKLPSGEVRMVLDDCRATIGQVGNRTHEQIVSGKAGRTRWLGRRPKVRGVAMNPVDHPMGGGEGKSSGGRHPSTPWGKPTKGYKTRKKNKKSNSMIVKRR